MRWFYEAGYDYGRFLPLPRAIHGFVRDKPTAILRALRQRGLAMEVERGGEHRELPWEEVHTEAARAALQTSGGVARAAELRWLPGPVLRHAVLTPQLRASAGTVAALAAAAGGAWCANLSGGFHHARPDLSHGFCLVNDVAVAVAALRRRGPLPRVLVLDVDLHQGDGNAAAFAAVPEVFTASMHQQSAFPHPKLHSDLDVALPDGLDDALYLQALDRCLAAIAARFEPQVVVLVAGTDVLAGDTIGTFKMTVEGVAERERRVARYAQANGAGLVLLTAGGYSPRSAEAAAAGMAAVAEVGAG